jgi:hypothetical protein
MKNVVGGLGELKLLQQLSGSERIQGEKTLRIHAILSQSVQQTLQGVVSLLGGHSTPIIPGSIFAPSIEVVTEGGGYL